MYDLLIKNTKVIDGSGAPAFSGTIAVKEGKLYVLPEHGRYVRFLYVSGKP